MLKLLGQIWDPFQNLLGTIYSAKKKSSPEGEKISANEAEELLEKGRALYLAIEGAVKEARQ